MDFSHISTEDIPSEREHQANTLTDLGIHGSVIENIVNMQIDLKLKADLLVQAIPDSGIIISHLSRAKALKMVTEAEYNVLVEQCLLCLNNAKSNISFTASFFSNDNKTE